MCISCLQWNYASSQSNLHGILYVLKTNSVFWVFLFWYFAITALDRAPQHSTNPHNRIMLQAFYSQRLFAKAVPMPALIFCTSRIYKQHNYISVKYTSDLQTELQVVSVLNMHLHSQWNRGTTQEGTHPTTQLRRCSPCTWPYSRSIYCRHLWRKLVFTVSIMCEGMYQALPFALCSKSNVSFSPLIPFHQGAIRTISKPWTLHQLKLISIVYYPLPFCFCADFLYGWLQAWHIQTLRLGYKSQNLLAKQWLRKLI